MSIVVRSATLAFLSLSLTIGFAQSPNPQSGTWQVKQKATSYVSPELLPRLAKLGIPVPPKSLDTDTEQCFDQQRWTKLKALADTTPAGCIVLQQSKSPRAHSIQVRCDAPNIPTTASTSLEWTTPTSFVLVMKITTTYVDNNKVTLGESSVTTTSSGQFLATTCKSKK